MPSQPGLSPLPRSVGRGRLSVDNLALSPDQTHVVVTVATTREAGPLLTEGTIFWVVKPRLFAGNVSGIETLLSGSYIGMLPTAEAGKSQRDFVGREDPPVLSAHVPGHTYGRGRRH